MIQKTAISITDRLVSVVNYLMTNRSSRKEIWIVFRSVGKFVSMPMFAMKSEIQDQVYIAGLCRDEHAADATEKGYFQALKT